MSESTTNQAPTDNPLAGFRSSTGFDLAEHIPIDRDGNDGSPPWAKAAPHRMGVAAYKLAGNDAGPASVNLDITASGFSMSSCLLPDTARTLARALLQAADRCEAFEAAQTMAQELKVGRL